MHELELLRSMVPMQSRAGWWISGGRSHTGGAPLQRGSDQMVSIPTEPWVVQA